MPILIGLAQLEMPSNPECHPLYPTQIPNPAPPVHPHLPQAFLLPSALDLSILPSVTYSRQTCLPRFRFSTLLYQMKTETRRRKQEGEEEGEEEEDEVAAGPGSSHY